MTAIIGFAVYVSFVAFVYAGAKVAYHVLVAENLDAPATAKWFLMFTLAAFALAFLSQLTRGEIS